MKYNVKPVVALFTMKRLLALLVSAATIGFATAAETRYVECDHPNLHPGLQVAWRASADQPHRSELVYSLHHEHHDHLRHVTDLRFEVELSDQDVISETHTICGPSNQARAHCVHSLLHSNRLQGRVVLALPYSPELGFSRVSVLEPETEREFAVVYKMCPE